MTNLLVIEDDIHVRMLYVEELMSEGYSVVASPGGSGILSLIRAVSPDVVLLEPHLKTCDGLKVLQAIRDAFPALPLVVCSASDSLLSRLRGQAAPGFALLSKSRDLNGLKAAVQQARGTPAAALEPHDRKPSAAPDCRPMKQQVFSWNASYEQEEESGV